MREALNSILQASNWEAMPTILNSLNMKFHEALSKKRRGKNIIWDKVYLLRNLAAVSQFAAGLYLGGEALAKLMLQLVEEFKAQAFRDRIEKKRWWDTQTELAEFYAFLLRALSRIGAHSVPELRAEFWTRQTGIDRDGKVLSEMRGMWRAGPRARTRCPS